MPPITNWRIKILFIYQLATRYVPITNWQHIQHIHMAGGTTTILLKKFTEKDLVLLENFIKKNCKINEKGVHFWDIHTANKKIKPHGSNGDLRPFVITFFEKKSDIDDDLDNQTLIKNLGYSNTCAIDVSAMCSDAIDQRLLAELTLQFAEMFNGLIYLNGLLTPPNSSNYEDALIFAKSIKGETYFATYTLENGKKWANQIVNPTYLKNWLAHENFRMIK